jgi:hypothetical protein
MAPIALPPPPMVIEAPAAMQTQQSTAPFQQSTPIPYTAMTEHVGYDFITGKGKNAGRFLNQRQKLLLARRRNHRK